MVSGVKPLANLIIITTGEVNGNIEKNTALLPSGLMTANSPIMKPNTNGMVKGITNCCVSASESTAAPTAANKALYRRKPPRK